VTRIRSTTRVSPGVLFVEGPLSNWTVFHGGDDVELVDCGYPADRPLRPLTNPDRRAIDDVVHWDRW